MSARGEVLSAAAPSSGGVDRKDLARSWWEGSLLCSQPDRDGEDAAGCGWTGQAIQVALVLPTAVTPSQPWRKDTHAPGSRLGRERQVSGPGSEGSGTLRGELTRLWSTQGHQLSQETHAPSPSSPSCPPSTGLSLGLTPGRRGLPSWRWAVCPVSGSSSPQHLGQKPVAGPREPWLRPPASFPHPPVCPVLPREGFRKVGLVCI